MVAKENEEVLLEAWQTEEQLTLEKDIKVQSLERMLLQVDLICVCHRNERRECWRGGGGW